MVKVKIEVRGLAETRREIDRFKRRAGMRMGEFADFSAKVVRDSVVRRTQPFGSGKKAREMGENAVKSDLLKIFLVVPERARMGSGVVKNRAEAKRWHESRRGSRGRTRRGSKKKIVVSVFQAYLAEVQARVGMAKGAMVAGDPAELKGRFQGWILRARSRGRSRRRRAVTGAMWKFSADPKHVASKRVMGESGIRDVMRRKDRALLAALRRKERAAAKKAEREANRRGVN
jgi:hypothetical protein